MKIVFGTLEHLVSQECTEFVKLKFATENNVFDKLSLEY